MALFSRWESYLNSRRILHELLRNLPYIHETSALISSKMWRCCNRRRCVKMVAFALKKASSGTFGSRVLLSTDSIWPSSCMVILCTPRSHRNKWSDHWSHAVTGKLRHKKKIKQRQTERYELTWERYSTGGNQEVECQQGGQKTQSRCPLHCTGLVDSAVLSLKLSMEFLWLPSCALHSILGKNGNALDPFLYMAHVMKPRSFV